MKKINGRRSDNGRALPQAEMMVRLHPPSDLFKINKPNMTKKNLNGAVLISMALIGACATATKKQDDKPGMTRTIVTYVYNANENEYRTGAAERHLIDTLQPDPKDKTKNIPRRDTIYNLAIFDQVRDSLGKVIKVGERDSVKLRWVAVNPNLILVDYNRDYMQYLPKPAQPNK